MNPPDANAPAPRLRLGISACLLGQAVRYDGGHKRRDPLLDRFGSEVHWWPICPEVEVPLGVPRPPIRLEYSSEGVRLRGVEDREDHTEAMARCVQTWVGRFRDEGVAGFVLKQRSPSCGPGDAPLHDRRGHVLALRDGIFAAGLREALPLLPMAGDEELESAAGRESFLARAEAYAAFARVLACTRSVRSFHRSHRSLISLRAPGALLRLRAQRESEAPDPYARLFFRAMQKVPRPDDHVRVLLSLAALVGQQGSLVTRRRVDASLDAYQNGAVHLATVVRTLAAAAEDACVVGLSGDAYLEPSPLRFQEYKEM